jgi:hypothetical protein
MAIRKPKKKAKKNPYRLSSDRQPGIKKANEKKPKRRPLPKGLEDFFKRKPKPKIPRDLLPYRPKTPKDLDKYYQLLKAKPKSGQAKPKVTKKRGGGIAKRGMGKAK